MTKNPAAVELGSIKSEKKARASRLNGLKGGKPHNLRGGRPKKKLVVTLVRLKNKK